jgi:hypothetical protein
MYGPAKAPTPPRPTPVLPDFADDGSFAPRDAEDDIKLDGEWDGRWLKVVPRHRRVDVMIQGLNSLTRTKYLNVTAFMQKDDNKSAVLVLEDVVNDSALKKTVTVWNIGGRGGRRGPMPTQSLRPRRELGGVSIIETITRVLVLGPDVENNSFHVGHYALTQPAVEHLHGPKVVAVKFPGRSDHSFFHWVYLCLSENVEILDCPATVFS